MSYVLAFFKIEKFTNETMMIFVASQHFWLDILYGIYDLISFVEFDSPEMCEGGAVE